MYILQIMNFKTKLKYFLFDIFDMISFLIFVGGIVLFIRFFVANPYTVVGASMSPTFEENDFIIVDKVTPRFSELKRGDVIVFVPPGKTIPYIKRIVGLPGETVRIKKNSVEICSTENAIEQCNTLDEPYLTSSAVTEARC
jgi:signal peptidase I